ncbi:succinate dehydrogenase, cytochrome b556 subunit [Gammaproteobacteria bacterium]|nr:succinate dehydrogenase, cytochrome b556 subunit [Pseudomonadota bacterium]MBT6931899.1 succinate dehydrogenase, cytochrome b556 subunit [Pseudomonadota bacterium]MDB4826650.1 succinate dehydrogenase, cytochrome b556 subunit [Gammaproteobacteria bacterium]
MTNPRPRPISPHLQIYKPQLTAVLSSLHRVSGLFLSAAAVGLAGWVITLALGESVFAIVQQFLSSGYGTGLIALGLFGFFYHLANGLRHLCWDRGYGYDIKNVYRSGWIVVACSITAGIVAILIAL